MGGVTDVFIDRGFGHNFDPANEWDRNFIDQAPELNERSIESGLIKPTQMIAAMTKSPRNMIRQDKHLSPYFCFRHP
jgi:hypothetical protein